jgi:hypothetical protein
MFKIIGVIFFLGVLFLLFYKDTEHEKEIPIKKDWHDCAQDDFNISVHDAKELTEQTYLIP